jgi:6-pyruvoyl-tetrahydropterin synthase
MGRVIRLTENEFHSLVKRLVKETKDQYDEDLIEGEDEDKMTKEDAVEKIADFFKDKVFPKVKRKNPELMTKLKKNMHSHKMNENFLYEEDEDDDDEKKSLKDRKSDRKEKAMIGGGLGVMGTGMVASLGEFMGYSESDMTNFLHDLNHMAGLEEYTGVVTVGMVFAGMALALKGVANRYDRTGK